MLEAKKNLGKGKPFIVVEPADRAAAEASYDLTPAKVERIMQVANTGDSREQSRLAKELLEKNDVVAHSLGTRVNAVRGCGWRIMAPEGGGKAEEAAAAALQEELHGCGDADEREGFDDLVENLAESVLTGFLVSEILWVNGGEIAGFYSLPGEAVHFVDSFFPRVITTGSPQGVELPRERYVFHRRRGKDPARGGLIRPLAWLHCFRQINMKDLLGFVERHGMPFVVAKVDQQAFEGDWRTMQRLVRNFGPSGGGVITRNVELQLLESSSTGEVYFTLLKYVDDAMEKLILGQLASSGESAGLSKGDAQSKVRQDILEADCRAIIKTVNLQVIKPWMAFNYAPSVGIPSLVIDFEAPEDKLQLAQTVQTLAGAGLQADPEEMSQRFGMKLSRVERQEEDGGWLRFARGAADGGMGGEAGGGTGGWPRFARGADGGMGGEDGGGTGGWLRFARGGADGGMGGEAGGLPRFARGADGSGAALAAETELRVEDVPGAALKGWLSPAARLLERLAGDLSDDELAAELSALRDAGAADVFGDSGGFERLLGEHIAENMALGAGAAFKKARGRG